MTHRALAREASRLRREYGLPWPEIADWLGYATKATARTAALKTALLPELVCVDCGAELERTNGPPAATLSAVRGKPAPLA